MSVKTSPLFRTKYIDLRKFTLTMSLGQSELSALIIRSVFESADRSSTDESSLLYNRFSEAFSQPAESTPEESAVQKESSGVAEDRDIQLDKVRDNESDKGRVGHSGSGAVGCYTDVTGGARATVAEVRVALV